MSDYHNFTNLEHLKILDVKDKVKKAVEELDMTLRKMQMRPQYFVTGGCIGSLLRNEVPNDYDVYFLTEGVVNLISNLYKHDESYKNEVEIYDEKYREFVDSKDGRIITENAITLKNKIQLITKHYGSPDAVRKTFDFVHCMPYFDPVTDKLYISQQQYDLCVNKKLLINNSDAVTAHRKSKFFERGWTWL